MAQTVRSAHFLFNSDKFGRDPYCVPGPRFTRPHFIALILRQTRDTEDVLQSAPLGRSISGTECLRCKNGGITYTTVIKVSIPAVPSV